MSLSCDWQTSKRKLKQRSQHLLETGECSDCNFIVGQEQQTFKSHKLFLAMSSPVFQAMFYGGMAEKNDPILIRDIQPEAFKALLEYIYTNKVELDSFELACELCYCAKKYMLPSLIEKCTKFMRYNLSPQNSCQVYQFSKLFEEPVLEEKSLQIICTKTDEVLKEASWEDIELGTLLMVLEQDDLQISEIKLFTALERWARSECSRKSIDPINGRSVIGNALTKIRFLSLNAEEFARGPCVSSLLTKDEAFAILMNIVCNNETPMPEGFCTQRFSRARSIKTPGDGECNSTSSSVMRNTLSSTNPENLLITALWSGIVMRNGPKYYCTRYISSRNYDNSGILRHSMKFSVDKNICVVGVQVPMQNHCEIHSDTHLYCDTTYIENICVRLLDCNDTVLTYTCLTAAVSFSTLVELMFNRPVYIQKHKVYRFVMEFAKTGSYSVGAGIRDKERCGSVMFTFHRDETSIKDGFIKSIIFTYH